MNILTITSLYPNAVMPGNAVFVENRLTRIVRTGLISARVIAPVPWFPFSGPAFGKYGAYAACPHEEERNGIPVSHPRYLVIPKLGLTLQTESYLHAIRQQARRLVQKGFDFDLIDAHYVYPDGVAATRLANELRKPIVVTARGSDLNLIAEIAGPRKQITAAFQRMDALITVSEALAARAQSLGMPQEKITVLRNGVDGQIFHPVESGSEYFNGSDKGPILLSVGNLVTLKRHNLVIRALLEIPAARLLIAGEGPERQNLERLVTTLGLGPRVRFLGRISHEDLAAIYSQADILILASEREGWPNVLLEAMACGTPVVASKVGGVPEIVTAPEAGLMFEELSPGVIAATARALLANLPARELVRAHALKFDWDVIVARQASLYRQIAERASAHT